ncbi:restriction endonuclease subunit M [Pediococcus pentosaceus]|uniref:restriction endonuclease subunit S n=1 Tax=Pediococcus pentosaceus TaxID=1255 RepID=UPI0021B07E64|nr:restriction endonuclease subunit S [Pediococcus pentosaceus]MCT1178619.1 restriction endonuclease subunit M [Pediococcus pentosaceus]
MKITELVTLTTGSPQFRIKESISQEASIYKFYNQTDLESDLTGIKVEEQESKQIKTLDKVTTLNNGDIIFSLISGSASIVKQNHKGYLFTQNYVLLNTSENIDPGFLVYLLNEDRLIERQFRMGLQGSMVLKYTVKQLRELKLPNLPAIEKQRIIGSIYLKQLRLQALYERRARNEMTLRLSKLQGAYHA